MDRPGGDTSPCQLLLQTGQAGIQSRRAGVQGLIAQPDKAQLRVGPPVAAAGQVGTGGLELTEYLGQPGRGQQPVQTAEGGLIISSSQESCPALGGGLANQQVPGQGGQLVQQAAHVLSGAVQPGQGLQCSGGLPLGDLLHQGGGLQVARQAQGGEHLRLADGARGVDALVQQGQGVPQAAVGQPGQQGGALRGESDALLLRHIAQPPGDVPGQNPLEGELLAPGFDGSRHLVQLGGGQNEHQVLGRLLQNLQQCVEGGGGQHVNLVHDIHPLADCRRGVHRLVPQGADLIHAVVGGGIQLQYVKDGAVLNAQTGGALVAGVTIHRVLTVHRPGQDFGAGGLAGAPGAGKEVSMRQATGGHLPLEGVGNMALAHHVVEASGPPLAVERLIHLPHTPCFLE